MYLTKKEVGEMKRAAEEIKRISTLETCSIDFGANRERVKKWARYFDAYANTITKILDSKEESNND